MNGPVVVFLLFASVLVVFVAIVKLDRWLDDR